LDGHNNGRVWYFLTHDGNVKGREEVSDKRTVKRELAGSNNINNNTLHGLDCNQGRSTGVPESLQQIIEECARCFSRECRLCVSFFFFPLAPCAYQGMDDGLEFYETMG
jgi:hypothetical protein